ncbi:exo-beta-N-acetylmuramidase NamZ family protein [Mumia sp. DW29H23]|uniref:exo-beta-N-acetylmuramidase NamZ family protein n=1 Tax=Mumia sp. DW29H23 TaxID=3421241 RepID=UPI003D68D3E1
MRRRDVLAGMLGVASVPILGGKTAAAAATSAAGGPGSNGVGPQVRTGFETLAASGYQELRGQRVGMISNPTGILRDLTHEVDVLAASPDVDIVAVFGPEHGFRGVSQAGQGQAFFIDAKTGLPVYNAYNDAARMSEQFAEAGIDTVVFDIQDVGARFYTYIWTMYLAMEAAAELDLRFVVLDRPNPITGIDAEGPVLHPEHSTFVGLKPISQQHGMTVGELAQLFNGEFLPPAIGKQVDLTVVPMRNWFRDMWFDETGLPWVLPSPNMPTVDTATVYPGTALFEATALSEGRGTTRPFELIGAPNIDHRWAEALNERELPGVRFREAYFTPTISKQVNKVCGGVQVYVEDRDAFDAIKTGLAMIVTQRQEFPEYRWRSQDVTSFWLDKLTGTDRARLVIDAGGDVDEIVAGWQEDLAEFRRKRKQYLIYHHVRGGRQ